MSRGARPPRPVPAPPYFHGTRRPVEIGALLTTRPVNPNETDADCDMRPVAWATADYEKARVWARRPGPQGRIAYVYAVEIAEGPVEVAPMSHRPWDEGPYVDVMAPQIRVVGLVSEEPVTGL